MYINAMFCIKINNSTSQEVSKALLCVCVRITKENIGYKIYVQYD